MIYVINDDDYFIVSVLPCRILSISLNVNVAYKITCNSEMEYIVI